MADITLMGASYPDVPAVELPQTGGGTVIFYDAIDGDDLTYGAASSSILGAGQIGSMIIE